MADTDLRRVALLGASGRTGMRFIALALARGLEVRALVRTPSSLGAFEHQVQVVQGDAADPAKVRAMLEGCQAVVSALGARGMKHSGLHVRAMPVVAAAMKAAGITRYVGLNSAAAFLPTDQLSLGLRLFRPVGQLLVGRYFADKKAEVDALTGPEFEWTLLRAGPLTDSDHDAYRAELDSLSSLTAKTTRAAVARAMLDALLERKWVRQAPYLLSAR